MRSCKKNSTYLVIALLSISALFGLSISTIDAQLTPYNVNGTAGANSVVWHNIYGIKQNDLVLISISGSDLLDTFIYYPNQTLCASSTFSSRPYYQFNASLSGTYLLKLTGWSGGSVNYSISSSHSINDAAQLTPYNVNGTAGANSVVWHNIYGIKQNDLVLISISGSDLIDTSIYYPNQTLCASSGFSNRPYYQFNASLSATFLLYFT